MLVMTASRINAQLQIRWVQETRWAHLATVCGARVPAVHFDADFVWCERAGFVLRAAILIVVGLAISEL